MLRTRDAGLGLVEFWMIPDFKEEFMRLIDALNREIPIAWTPRSEHDRSFGVVNGVGYSPDQDDANSGAEREENNDPLS